MSTTHYVTATGEVPCGKVNYRTDYTATDGDAVPVDCPDCRELMSESTCSAVALHGNPFKYCPCGWSEDETPATYAQGAEAVPGSTTPTVPPHGGALAVTNEQVYAELLEVKKSLASISEFVDVLKSVGAAAANGKGMQATMLRNMVPGLELLGGQ
jgi:hypothetical protein